MTHYRPHGRAHNILERLVDGPATLAELRDHAGLADNPPRRREHWYALGALIEDGAVVSLGERYAITRTGFWTLVDLKAEAATPARPNVRRFA